MAQKKKKSEFAGKGAVVQLLGVICFFLGFLGGFVGVAVGTCLALLLLIIGSRMAIKLICSDCGNKVEKTSKICPTCKAQFA